MFENTNIPITSIPHIDNQRFSPIDVKYRWVSMIYTTIFSLILMGFWLVLFFTRRTTMDLVLIGSLVIIGIVIAFSYYVSYFGYTKKKYQLRQRDIIFRKGIWWTSETTVPFVRVQHSEVIQGPVERIFGLAKLKLYTAGGQTSDLSIPGLRPEIAEDLKAFISESTTSEEEE